MPKMQARDGEIDYDLEGPDLEGPDIAGAGTPLIWGHGLTSSRGISAAYPLVDLVPLRAGRAVVRYDARGHGLSSRLDDPTKGSWAELALDQIALIDHLGFDQVAIGGVSMGAGTALHSALSLGTRLEKMVLVIPPTGWEERAPQVELYEQMARVVEARGPKALIAAAAEMPPPDPFVGSTDYVDRRAGSLGAALPDQLASCFRGAAFADLPSLADIATISAPTLVLAWSGDPGHPVSTAERLGETLANVEVAIASTAAEFDSWSGRVAEFLASP